MNNRRTVLFTVAGLLAAVLLWWRVLPRGEDLVPLETLETQAMDDSDRQLSQEAAASLASRGPGSVDYLRRIAAQGPSPDVRAVAIDGLGSNWDYESMEFLLTAMDDPSPRVRARAASVVAGMIGRERNFQPLADPRERQRIIAAYRDDWAKMKDSELRRNFEQELEARRAGK
jgi:hypothetical protein